MPDSFQMENVACNLCGNSRSQKLFDKLGLPIARCSRCGLVYANPRLAQNEIWKRYSSDYFWQEYMPAHNASGGEYAAAWHRQRALPILRKLASYRASGRFLEVGCAAGFLLKVAEQEGWQPQGVEIMSPAVEYARSCLGLDVYQGTLSEASFPASSFDAAVIIETIEHVLDPLALLRETYRVLRPGAALWVATPNFNSLMRTLLGTAWSVLSPAEHLFYFTEETLTHMLEESGFRSVKFFWQDERPGSWLEVLNPHNTHEPSGLRSRSVRRCVLAAEPCLAPLAARFKRTDRLSVLATK